METQHCLANSLNECISVWEAGKSNWAGLEADVYLTALLKGGGLEDIDPGLSLSQFP